MQNWPNPPQHLDFEEVESQRNLGNLAAMEWDIANREEGLTERIAHYSERFGIPPREFWNALDRDPSGPLAAVLATDARRQNIHEEAAAAYIEQLAYLEDFERLQRHGGGVSFIEQDGQIITRNQLARRAPRPSEAIDFRWRTGRTTCYAAQKYTREGGGNQDSRFDETIRLLSNFRQHHTNGNALVVVVDGPYYDDDRLEQLQALVRDDSPRSYVASINDLQPILNQISAE